MPAESASIDTSAGAASPTIEDSYKALVEEGVITEDNAETPPSKEAEGAGQGEDGVEGGDNDRPSWLPEKFKSPEDMAKAYAELEKKQSAPKTKEGEGGEDGETAPGEGDDEAAAREAVSEAGLDWDALTDEYDNRGKLSETSMEALRKAGIPDSVVEAYIAGLEAQTALYESSVKEVAGGDEAYDSLLKWGESNLSSDEIEAFDEAVNSGDMKIAKIAVKGLMAQMQLSQGVDPAVHVDGKGNNGGSDVYESAAQMEADMNDPRYQTDEAFRQKVYAKLARSNF